jgi:protein TonB
MILRLLESRRARRIATGALLASVAVHAGTFGAAARDRVPAAPAAHESLFIRYILPPDRVEQPAGERIQFVAVGQGTSGRLDGADALAPPAPDPGARSPQQATRRPEPVDEGEQQVATALFTEDQVDSVATRDPNSGGPDYPDALRERGVQGEVLVEFTVDTTGRADPGSFEVVQASHPLFAQAVREALPRMLFTPAVARGQRVRQLVRLPMKFRLLMQDKGAA